MQVYTRFLFLFVCFYVVCLPITAFGQSLEENSGQRVSEYEDVSALRIGSGTTDAEPAMQLPPPGNDNCASATVLTVDGACTSGTTNTASQEAGEYLCISPGGGIAPETVWYRFTANNDSLVLGFIQTNSTNCATVLAAYGPFAPGTGCFPGAGSQLICQNMALIDPGFHPLLTGLVVGQDYLVQVQGNSCGGPGDRFSNYCVGVSSPAANAYAGSAAVINNCGVAVLGNTSGGHWGNGTSIGQNNLDNNLATTAPGTSEAGDDVAFVINNLSWFTFCNGNAVSCDWSMVLNGISGCQLPAPNAGVQAAVFTGNPTALTSLVSSPSIIAQGGSWSSGNFTIAAGGCAYIAVDGFAGDECDYNLTLTNSSCPCALLPLDLAFMSGRNFTRNISLNWEMNSQEGLDHFELAHSSHPEGYAKIAEVYPVKADFMSYEYNDINAVEGWNYYTLTAVSQDGNSKVMKTISVFRAQGKTESLNVARRENELTIILNAKHTGIRSVQVLDLQGQELLKQDYFFAEGNNNFVMDVAQLSSGLYLVKIDDNASQLTTKFIR